MTTPSGLRHLVIYVKSRAVWAVLAVSLLMLTACKEERPLREVTMALSWVHSSQYSGSYYADQNGLYAQEGLHVSFVPGSYGHDPMKEFVSGKYDFVIASPDNLAQARLDGHKVKAVAATYRLHPLGFAVLESSGIKRPEDFPGKTVALPYSSKAPLFAMLRKLNVDPEGMKLLDFTEDFEKLKSGEIDIMAVWVVNELQTARRAGLKLNVFAPHDYGITMYSELLVARESTIEQEPELVQAFVRATLRGWTEALQDPEKNSRLVLRYDPALDPAHEFDRLKASAPLIHTGVDRIGWMRAEDWEAILATLHQEGVLRAMPDASEIFTTRFMETPQQP
ncbi:MAG TPA: ABC transporter substrate-binding protein [Haliangium sp.]|nr:ABC transporter substrate-binding protein [Haliangium sp.]